MFHLPELSTYVRTPQRHMSERQVSAVSDILLFGIWCVSLVGLTV